MNPDSKNRVGETVAGDKGRGYYAGEAASITGIPYRTIDHWARTSLIRPTISEGKGRGRNRLYSFADLIALRIVRELREKGTSIQSLRKVIKLLRSSGMEDPLSDAQLLVIGKDVAIVNNAQQIESVLSTPGQLYLSPGTILDLRKPVAEVRRKITRFRVA